MRELLQSGKIEAAYTTVMTTLDRLYKKGFLDRDSDVRDGRKFSPACLTPMMGRSLPNRVNRFGPTDLTVGSK